MPGALTIPHPAPRVKDVNGRNGMDAQVLVETVRKTTMTQTTLPSVTATSRAALRRVEAGNMALCAHCDEQVKFAAKLNRLQVIANVYEDGRWVRVEHFHEECYEAAHAPYGEPSPPVAKRQRSA